MQQLMGNATAAGSAIEKAMRLYPPFLQANSRLWGLFSKDDVTWIVLVSVGCIIFGTAISYLSLFRRELK
jgi:hypothetical protein